MITFSDIEHQVPTLNKGSCFMDLIKMIFFFFLTMNNFDIVGDIFNYFVTLNDDHCYC